VAGCLVILLALTLVGQLLAVPVWVPGRMAAQTPPEHPGAGEWVVLTAVSVLTALAVVRSAGRRRPVRWPSLIVRTVVLLGLCAAVVLWTRDRVETENWSLEAGLEGLAAGLTAVLVRSGVRRWERGRPMPGEIWLAMVPFRDKDEAAQHYCVVVGRRLGHAEVLQITSQNKDSRRHFVQIPNDGWDFVSGKAHWLEVGLPPRKVPYADFLKDRPQGPCPKATWRHIRNRRRGPKAREAGAAGGGERQNPSHAQ